MNKTFLVFSLFAFLYALELTAQIPPHINYQAVLRNTQNGEELSNQEVFIVAKFIDGGPQGEIVYQEEHNEITTSLLGLINLQLGDGYAMQGSFQNIPWANGNIWLSIEIDAGEGLKPLGTTKFSSVPYALYAASGPESEPNLDNDPTNEIQDLNISENVLTITDHPNATPIDLNPYVNIPNLDNDPTNEIQDLLFWENKLKISGNDFASEVDLGNYKQDLKLTGNILKITNNPTATPIDLGAFVNPTGGIQDLSLNNNILLISDNPGATPISLADYVNVPNLDNDPTNEIQDLILLGNTLKISDNPAATPISLADYVNVPNLDNDPTNEIQDLILLGNTLKISDNPAATPINLGMYENQTLPQGAIFIGNEASVATPIILSGDVNLTDAGTAFVGGLRNIPISITAPTDGQKLAYNAGTNTWEPVSDTNSIGTEKFYSIDPMDFVELNDPTGSSKLDKHNGLRFFNEKAPFAMLRKTGIRKIGAPVYLPHGSTITGVKIYLKDKGPGNMLYSLERKKLSSFALTNIPIASGSSNGINGNAVSNLPVSTIGLVDNQEYTYRFFVTFTRVVEDDDEDDHDDVEQAVYGVVITYIE